MTRIIRCQNCKKQDTLYELAGSKLCRSCWHQYWLDNDIGEDTSFEDFISYTCSEIKDGTEEKT